MGPSTNEIDDVAQRKPLILKCKEAVKVALLGLKELLRMHFVVGGVDRSIAPIVRVSLS